MYHRSRVLAVVPARGGSKGVPFKNIHPLCGRPLISWTGDVVRDVPDIDCAVVSTDDEKIASVAEANGLRAPFRRPADISGDTAGDIEVLIHALKEMEKNDGVIYDVVVMLQPTAPLRTAEQVSGAIRLLVDEGYDAVWTVTPTDLKYHPNKQLKISDGCLGYCVEEGKKMLPRQALEPVYHVNGVAYAITRECILDQKSRLGNKTGAFIIDGPSVSIDTLADFSLVKQYMGKTK